MKHGRAVLLAAALAGCATAAPPVTKIVNGRLVVSRSIGPSAYEHVSRALLLEDDERWNDAAAELQRALVFDSDSPELQAHLAETFIRAGRPEDAAAAVKASLAAGTSVDGLVAEAHLHQLQGDPSGGLAALERAVALVSFTEDEAQAESTYLELGEAALLALDHPRARSAYERLCNAEPGSLNGRLRLAGLTWALGDVAATEKRLGEALTEEPNQLDALLTLAGLYAATGRAQAARARYQDALDRSEGAPEMATAYARFLMATGARADAEQVADDLAPVDTSDLDSVTKRLEIERVIKRFPRAHALLDGLAKGEPPEEIRTRLPLLRAQIFNDEDKHAEAVKVLLAVPDEDPAFLDARLQAAEILREDGRTTEAAKAIAEGTVDAGDDERGQLELVLARALVDERRGDPARGVRRLEEALTKRPGQIRLSLTLAALEERRGQWKRALEITDKVLTKEPGNVEALNFWGYVAADHNHDLPRATRRLISALALDPGSGSIVDSVGWAHLQAGEVPRAALFLEQAVRLDPEDPEVLSHVGALYLRQSQPDQAIRAFRKALGLHPEDKLRRKLEDELARLESRKAARP